MAKDALERLYDSNNNQEESSYSLEEQMESAEDDDFLDGMSDEAENALYQSITEVTIDEPEESSDTNDEEDISESIPKSIIKQIQNSNDTEEDEEDEENNEEDNEDEGLVVSNLNIVNEVKKELNEQTSSSIDTENTQEELFNNNTDTVENIDVKKPRKYTRRKQPQEEDKSNSKALLNSIYNPIMDQIAKDIIDNLRKSKYKINRFDDETMKIVFNYMYEKF